jgi:hypothetical protein
MSRKSSQMSSIKDRSLKSGIKHFLMMPLLALQANVDLMVGEHLVQGTPQKKF